MRSPVAANTPPIMTIPGGDQLGVLPQRSGSNSFRVLVSTLRECLRICVVDATRNHGTRSNVCMRLRQRLRITIKVHDSGRASSQHLVNAEACESVSFLF